MAHALTETSRISFHNVRSLTHRLHTAGKNYLGVIGSNAQIGQSHGTHARGTNFVDRGRLGGLRQTGGKQSLTRGNLTTAGLNNLTDNHFIDCLRIDFIAFDNLFDQRCSQLDGAQRSKRATQLSKGCSQTVDDYSYSIFHVKFSRAKAKFLTLKC
ncbi:MAG: hypothetical protein BWY75_03534 [bacterium ADurb.Bin425]|nr:MAG: hypothetical protein BWY75_03534 [bacterium ADurb.Bin425]